MTTVSDLARQGASVTLATAGRGRDKTTGSLVFLGALWFSLFFGVMVLLVLIVDTMIGGAGRFDLDLLTGYTSQLNPETTGFRAGILGTLWLMITTAALVVPLGVAAASTSRSSPTGNGGTTASSRSTFRTSPPSRRWSTAFSRSRSWRSWASSARTSCSAEPSHSRC